MSRRQEASGLGWQEHFVDVERASATLNVGSAVSKSLSYVTIPNFATVEERCALQESAQEVQSTQDGDQGVHILGASASNYNCTRYSVEALLNAQAKAASGAFLDRLLGFLEEGKNGINDNDSSKENEEMSDLAFQVFGHSSNLRQLQVNWYAEPDDQGQLYPEPKVNIYEEGGYFLKHGDGMHLTLLVVLSDSFEGGGTAFYKEPSVHDNQEGEEDDGSGGNDGDDNGSKDSLGDPVDSTDPESIAKPPAGTAVIWGATLLHMALPVTKGTRAVYVGSFELEAKA